MNKTFYEVVPADVLPDKDKDAKSTSKIYPAIDKNGDVRTAFYFFNNKQWFVTQLGPVKITHWLRPLPPDTVVVSDLDAVAERVIMRLDEMARKLGPFTSLPVYSPDKVSEMKEAVKEILKQQDNG